MHLRRSSGLYWPLALSLGGHAALLLVLVLGGRFSWPAPPIPIEVRAISRPTERIGEAARRGNPKTQAKPAPTQNKPSAPTKKSSGAGANSPKPKAPPSPPPPQTTDLRPYAPEGANLVVLLSMPALRSSPHRPGVERLLSVLPDWATLVSGSGLSPIDDLDALLIATADPLDMTATFLAARHPSLDRVRALAGRPLTPGDPRVFRVLSPEMIVLARPDAAARLDGAKANLGADDVRAKWLSELERFGRFEQAANQPGAPALLVSLSDVPSLLRFGAGLPTPQAIALATTAEASPAVRGKLIFADAKTAHAFVVAWPQILGRWRSATAFVGLAPAFDGLKIEALETTVEITGRVPEAQLRLGLSLAVALLPRAKIDPAQKASGTSDGGTEAE